MKSDTLSSKQWLFLILQGFIAYVGIVLWHEGMLRSEYERRVAGIYDKAMQKLSEESPEAVARWAVLERNYLKQITRDKGNPINKILAEKRNVEKYGNSMGPTYEQLTADLLKKGVPADMTNKQIISSAATSNQTINQHMNRTTVIGITLSLLYLFITVIKVFISHEDKIAALKLELTSLLISLASGTLISQLIANTYYFFVE
ncbi:MAG: hypothetical protein RMJ87_09665 [Cytophagales bacterium]|nr:hypothetical protein [Bernardetiaceae bacterium]MDW8205284.1 hypothetical protein [Cytophagales bacterium]